MPTPEHSPTEEIKQQTRSSGPRTRVRSGTRIKGTRSPDLFVFLKETESKTKATERKFRAPLSIDPQLRTLRSFSSRSLGAFLRGSSFFFLLLLTYPPTSLSLSIVCLSCRWACPKISRSYIFPLQCKKKQTQNKHTNT